MQKLFNVFQEKNENYFLLSIFVPSPFSPPLKNDHSRERKEKQSEIGGLIVQASFFHHLFLYESKRLYFFFPLFSNRTLAIFKI